MPSDFLLNMANKVMVGVPPAEDGSKKVDILLILSLLLSLAKFFKNCSPEIGADSANKLSLLNRLRLRRHIRSHLGREKYREVGEEVMWSIVALGANITVNDIEKLLDEASEQTG